MKLFHITWVQDAYISSLFEFLIKFRLNSTSAMVLTNFNRFLTLNERFMLNGATNASLWTHNTKWNAYWTVIKVKTGNVFRQLVFALNDKRKKKTAKHKIALCFTAFASTRRQFIIQVSTTCLRCDEN